MKTTVSIPDWSDWQQDPFWLHYTHFWVSIPDWSDWQWSGGRQALLPNEFQFQIGPIGSIPVWVQQDQKSLFQFQIGPIGSHELPTGARTIFTFQFQIGPIGSKWGYWYLNQFTRFNSRLVRLAASRYKKEDPKSCVSIPDWSDWQYLRVTGLRKGNPVSIPDWSDWQTMFANYITNTRTVSIPDWSDWQNGAQRLPIYSTMSFNSRLVRLAEETYRSRLQDLQGFNSRLVRLAVIYFIHLIKSILSFNSRLVRLAVYVKVTTYLFH